MKQKIPSSKTYPSTTTKRKTALSKPTRTKSKKTKKATAKLGGETITFNKGGLHKSLKVPTSYKFKTNELQRINKIPDGTSFKFQKEKIRMTTKIHKQLTLGLNLMRRKK